MIARLIPRMWQWKIAAALLLLLLWWIAPQNLDVVIYKLSLVTLAAVLGYHLDCNLFPYARPGDALADDHRDSGMAMVRRAIIVAAAMLGVTMGL